MHHIIQGEFSGLQYLRGMSETFCDVCWFTVALCTMRCSSPGHVAESSTVEKKSKELESSLTCSAIWTWGHLGEHPVSPSCPSRQTLASRHVGLQLVGFVSAGCLRNPQLRIKILTLRNQLLKHEAGATHSSSSCDYGSDPGGTCWHPLVKEQEEPSKTTINFAALGAYDPGRKIEKDDPGIRQSQAEDSTDWGRQSKTT